jgi:hypothetical protein
MDYFSGPAFHVTSPEPAISVIAFNSEDPEFSKVCASSLSTRGRQPSSEVNGDTHEFSREAVTKSRDHHVTKVWRTEKRDSSRNLRKSVDI